MSCTGLKYHFYLKLKVVIAIHLIIIHVCLFLLIVDEGSVKELGRVRILHKRTVMPYSVYKRRRKGPSDEEGVKQYATLVGQACSERMLLFKS